MVENQIQTTIKVVQTYWGGKLRPFQKQFSENGIHHRITCLHAHQQNGSI